MYDLIIIGAGSAGYSASIYAARSKMSVLLIGAQIGGTVSQAYEIENYPGFKKILGRDLAQKMKEHAEEYDIDIKIDTVKNISKKDNIFIVQTAIGDNFEAKTVLLATGTQHRILGAKGEKEFSGKGISYCATCDGFFFKDKTVAIIGGGDSAATAGLFLGEICKKVYIIVRKNFMRAEPFWIDKLEKNERVEFLFERNVKEFYGDKNLEGVETDKGEKIKVDGAFIQIGSVPNSSLADLIGAEKDKNGYIIVNSAQETNIKGLYSAGDVSTGSNYFHQVVTSVSEGAISANSAFMYIQ